MKIFENTAFGQVTEALIIKTWKTKTNFGDNHFHNILRHDDLLRNFPLPQVKRCPIITYKHGICKLSNDLPNDLRFRTLGNEKISQKFPNSMEWYFCDQSPCQSKSFVHTKKKLLKNRNSTFAVARHLAWKLELVFNILLVIVSGNLFLVLTRTIPLHTLTFLRTLRPFTLF